MKEQTRNKLVYLITHPRILFATIIYHTPRLWSDEFVIRYNFRTKMGYSLNLDNPQTFSEKLQWLKLYDRRPEYTTMVDKYAVKEYVASMLGKEYIIPTLGVWDRVEDIDWEKLPSRFVLKCTHDSGGLVICRDKEKLNKEAAKAKLRKSLKSSYFYHNREWPYKDVPRRIIAEKYIDPAPNVKDLPDYKWYCFNGEPKYCLVIQDRSTEETIDFFDTEWKHQEFVGLNPKVKNANTIPEKPANIETHLRIARELSKGIPFSRIDLYETGRHTYFGEITFFPMSGEGIFRPDQYNELLGHMIELPGESRGGVIIRQLQNDQFVIERPDLRDYKFFCFNGIVKCFKIDFDRQVDHHANYYTPNGELLPFGEKDFPPQFERQIAIPTTLPRMIELAEKLSCNHKFLRVDFYDYFGKIYFGEMTFFPASGTGKFDPEEYDLYLGEMLEL